MNIFTLNILTPPNISPSHFGEPLSGISTQDPIVNHVLSPDYHAKHINIHIGAMLDLHPKTKPNMVLFFSVFDTVEVSKNGVVAETWDVAEMFEKMRFKKYVAGTKEEFWEWRREQVCKLVLAWKRDV